jgi:hypothetical protein
MLCRKIIGSLAVGIATGYVLDYPVFKSTAIQIRYGPHTASSLVVIAFLFHGSSARGVKLTTHFYLAPRLRMSGAIPLLLLYACAALAGTTLPFTFFPFLGKLTVFFRSVQNAEIRCGQNVGFLMLNLVIHEVITGLKGLRSV